MLAVDPDFEREPEAAKADDEVQVRVQRLQNVSDSLCQTGRPRRRTHKLSLNEIPSTGRGGISYVRDVRITSEQGGMIYIRPTLLFLWGTVPYPVHMDNVHRICYARTRRKRRWLGRGMRQHPPGQRPTRCCRCPNQRQWVLRSPPFPAGERLLFRLILGYRCDELRHGGYHHSEGSHQLGDTVDVVHRRHHLPP